MTLVVAGCGSNGKKSSSKSSAAGDGGAATGGSSASAGTTAASTSSGASATCTAIAEVGELVQVPPGEFPMGCNAAVDDACSDDEKPLHTVTLSAFEIDKTEVTQGAYTACIVDGACEAPGCTWDCEKTDNPASCVTWAQAGAYCAWAGRRLPSEAEWEKAARGSDGNKYPWGNDEPTCALANMAGCGDAAIAVGSLSAGASPYGALDMAGNVVELVADRYDAAYYAGSPTSDPPGPPGGSRYTGRGGGFKSDPEFLRTSKRDWYDASDAAASLGFRCAH